MVQVRKVKRFFRNISLTIFKSAKQVQSIFVPKQFSNPKSLRVGVAGTLLAVLLLEIFIPNAQNVALAGTATFVQSSWSGGVSTTAVAADPTNRTGWSYFNTSTNLDFTSSTALRLTSSTYSFTDDTTVTTTGNATGGGFASGAFSSTAYNSGGSVTLSTSTLTVLNQFDTVYPRLTSTVRFGKVIATGTYAYFLQGDTATTPQLQRLDKTTKTLTTYTALPAAIGGGSCMTMDASGSYFYVVRGLVSATIWRHSVTNTTASWESLTNLPSAASHNAYENCLVSDATYLYAAIPGGTGFARHTLSDTSSAWQSFVVLPGGFGDGGAVLYDATYLYVYRGGGNTGFYRHVLSDTSSPWDTFSITGQSGSSSGGGMVLDNGFAYIVPGANSTAVQRHTLSDTSSAWTALTVLPGGESDGGGVVTDGTYLYVTRGSNTASFYRHLLSTTTGSWDTFTVLPSIVYTGGSTAIDPVNGFIYVLGGSMTTAPYPTPDYWIHTTADTSSVWEGTVSNLTTLPGDVGAGGGLTYDSDYVYVLRGGSSTGFHRHSLFDTSSSWESFTALPAAVSTNGGVVNDGTYAYVLQGNSRNFYRHTLANTSSAWDTFTILPGSTNVNSGGGVTIDGSYVYVSIGNFDSGVYRHTLANTSSAWESFTFPTTITLGGLISIDGNYLYINPGGSTALYRHTVANTSSAWESFASIPQGTSSGSGIAFDGTSVYILSGNSTAVARHTVANTSSAWTSFAALGASITTGGGFTIANNTMYVMHGNTGVNFYRHTLSETSSAWIASTIPGGVTTGSSIKADNTGNSLFLLRGASPECLRFTINSVTYNPSGTFTSAAVTLNTASLLSMSWTSTTPSTLGGPSALRIQIATSSDNVSYSSFVGTDGTSGTYFNNGTSTISGVSAIGGKYFKYKAYLTTANTSYTPSLNGLTVNYRSYINTGTLISSVYNAGDPASRVSSMAWTGTTSSASQIKFQIRTASSSAGVASSTWTGPDGTTSTYFTVAAGGETVTSTYSDGTNDQYVQYQAFLTTDGVASPLLSSATFTYVINQAPQIQNVTASENSDGTITVAYQILDVDTSADTGSVGVLTPSFKYCPGGTACQTINDLTVGATSTQAVNIDGVTWTSITTTWTPHVSFSNSYDPAAKIQITVNDLQAANNSATATSSAFILDTMSPRSVSINVDASSTIAVITLAAFDTSTPVTMRVATSSVALSSAPYVTFTSTTALTLDDPSTIYAQFNDPYSNSSTVVSVTTPEKPTYVIIQDTSNVLPPLQYDYRLFVAWKAVALPPQGSFGAYKVYRSTDQVNWTLQATITDRTTNFYTDSTVPGSTREYYKIISTDSLGNVSFSSESVNGMADGVQDYGEGGGGTEPPPLITSITTSTITPSSFTVTWDTDTLSNSKISYSGTAGVFTSNVTVASYVNNASTVGQHQVIVAGLSPDTTYYFKVASTDASSNMSEQTNGGDGYIVHTSPGPTVTALPIATNVSNSSTLITWETSADANSIVYFSTSSTFIASSTASDLSSYSTTHSIIVSGLSANTTYYYYVASTDQSGYTVLDRNVVNGVAQYYTFSTSNDAIPPTFSGIAATVSTSSASIIWVTSESADSQVEYGLTTGYGSSTVHDSTLTVQHYTTITNLESNTSYYYRITSIDANGNVGISSGQTFATNQLDTIPPIISSVTTSSVALTQATINWVTDKQTNATVEYGTTQSYGSLAGNLYDFTSSTHSVTLIGLSGNTTYYFRVNSTDQSGNNATSSEYSFVTTADVTPPVISNITEIVDQTAAIVTWTTDELTMAEINYGLASTTLDITVSVTSTFSTSHSLVLAGLAPNTTYYFQVTSADTSANTTTETGLSFTTVAYGQVTQTITVTVGGSAGSTNAFADTVSASAPIVSGVSVKNVDPFSVFVSWLTDKDGNSLVTYGKTVNYGLLAGNEIGRAQTHGVNLINLDPATTYHFKAESFDASGNLGTSGDIVFTTLNAAGETVSSTPVSEAPATDATSSLKGFVLSQVKVAAADFLEQVLRAITSNPSLKQIPESSIINTITDITQRVVSAPAIVGLRPEVQVHGNQATIGWYTDKKTDGVVSYAKHSDYQPTAEQAYTMNAADITPFSTVHIVDLANLEPATQYHFQVISKGEIGSETKSKDFVFTTESVLPKFEELKIVKVTASSVDLSWRTNIPAATTIEYKNTVTKKTLTVGDTTLLVNHAFTVANLDPGAQYTLVIKAQNESKDVVSSDVLSFSTIVDNGAPTITNLAANSTLYPGKNSKVQTIMTWKTDEPASSQIFYQEGVQAKGTVLSTPFDANLTTDHILVLTNFKPGTVYKYWSESADSSGNASQSATFTMLTPIQKETIIDIIGKNFQSVFGWTNKVAL